MRLYYFTKDDFALDNIKNQRLKVSFADAVNDLFELKPFDFGSRKIRKAWQDGIVKHSMTHGFISFTENWKAPTMWAHYANNHKGVCYGFDVPPHELCEINYVNSLRPFDIKALSNFAAKKRETDYASRTKSSHWEYEKEWRQYILLDAQEIKAKAAGKTLFFIDFNDKLVLREVIIGAKSKIKSTSIRDILHKSNNVEIHTARPSFREYGMVQQNSSKLQK